MECKSQSNREYVIPARTKELKIPVVDVYFPGNWNSDEDVFIINFAIRSEVELNQRINYYIICQTSLDVIRLDLSADLKRNKVPIKSLTSLCLPATQQIHQM